MQLTRLLVLVASAMISAAAQAQVPVIDSANLTKATEIATSTQQILTLDREIMQFTQRTLQAVTGDRSSLAQGSLAQMALGGGFSMSQAPSLGQVISGGALSFAGLGSGSQNMVSSADQRAAARPDHHGAGEQPEPPGRRRLPERRQRRGDPLGADQFDRGRRPAALVVVHPG